MTDEIMDRAFSTRGG